MAYTKNRQFYDKYPELYINNLSNIELDYNKSFLFNLIKFFKFGIPTNISIIDNICRIFSNKYFNNNMIFKSMNSVYALAYVSVIYTTHTNITYDIFIKAYNELCKDIISDDFMKNVYIELQNISFN